MKALELANALEGECPSMSDLTDAAAELRLLAEVNAELLESLEKSMQPLELYKAYGWPDRAGVIFNAKQAIAKARSKSWHRSQSNPKRLTL